MSQLQGIYELLAFAFVLAGGIHEVSEHSSAEYFVEGVFEAAHSLVPLKLVDGELGRQFLEAVKGLDQLSQHPRSG